MKHLKNLLPVVAASLLVFGCRQKNNVHNTVRLATTTSVQDTGLLDVLTDAFQKDGNYRLQSITVGSGQAMQLGKTGEADILWVHSPDDEAQFVAEGYGIDRIIFMHNDFVILGPEADPAKIKGILPAPAKQPAGPPKLCGGKQSGGSASGGKAVAAFKKIAASGVLFVSRGDNSGTHKKEKKFWETAAIKPAKENYIEAGQGMAATVTIANEKNAYCLADRSTYLSLQKSIGLVILCEGDEALLNRYSLILVNPGKFPKVNAKGAKAFFDFLLSRQAKDIIEKFGVEKYGRQLFFYDYKNY